MSALLPAVSLFSNCGAGDLGYARAGFGFEVLAELDHRRLDIAGRNLPGAGLIPGDLRETWPAVIEEYRQRRGQRPPALLAACPPCQGMSSARGGRGREEDADAGSRDHRNLLVEVIAEVARELCPRIIVVENVPAFFRRRVRHPRTGAPVSAAVLLSRRLHRHYVRHALEADLADYGVPQTRKRAFLCFVRRDDAAVDWFVTRGRVPFPRPTHAADYQGRHITVTEALRELGAGRLDAGTPETAGTGMHRVPAYDPRRYAMVAATPTDGSGAWANDHCPKCRRIAGPDQARCDGCEALLLRPVVTAPDGTARLVHGFKSSSYTRMRADRPASTVTTASGHLGSDRTLHPTEHRVLSPRECQHLQTIPDEFDWGTALERWGATNVRAMIGEAVPPRFTELHGRVLSQALGAQAGGAALIAADPRVVRAQARLAQAATIGAPAT